ncbi:MAG TPA: hypothetical protein DDX85_07830 [Nitrospiraceae bacterium]|nr:hypothetical protein [Nitrospiraceae bacterium]
MGKAPTDIYKIVLYILMPAMLIMNTGELSAVQINGVYFHDSVTVSGNVMKIRGAGVLKWLFFNVYAAALYLPPDVSSRDVLEDVPKKMEFHYLSDMKAEQFTESGEPLLLKNASADELAQIREKIDAINIMYRDVKKGERYSLTYMPGKGTELALNGQVLGRIEGYDFAAVYYRIWLGENPVDDDLKEMLLNNAGRTFSSK